MAPSPWIVERDEDGRAWITTNSGVKIPQSPPPSRETPSLYESFGEMIEDMR